MILCWNALKMSSAQRLPPLFRPQCVYCHRLRKIPRLNASENTVKWFNTASHTYGLSKSYNSLQWTSWNLSSPGTGVITQQLVRASGNETLNSTLFSFSEGTLPTTGVFPSSQWAINAETILSACHHHSWWRHQMETYSALLTICAGNSPVTGEFPTQRPVKRSFDVFFHLRLIKRLSKQSQGWWWL